MLAINDAFCRLGSFERLEFEGCYSKYSLASFSGQVRPYSKLPFIGQLCHQVLCNLLE